jgi:hypothetical protein
MYSDDVSVDNIAIIDTGGTGVVQYGFRSNGCELPLLFTVDLQTCPVASLRPYMLM